MILHPVKRIMHYRAHVSCNGTLHLIVVTGKEGSIDRIQLNSCIPANSSGQTVQGRLSRVSNIAASSAVFTSKVIYGARFSIASITYEWVQIAAAAIKCNNQCGGNLMPHT